MNPRFFSRRPLLAFLLLASALPASAAQIVLEPVRLPAGALAAPMVGSRLAPSAALGLRSSLTPSLGAPTLSPSLAPRVQSPMPSVLPALSQPLPSGYGFTQGGIIVPAARAASVMGASVELGKTIARPDAQPSQVLSSFYEGSRGAAAAVELSAAEESVPAAPYLAETRGLSGAQLLDSLHQITGRGYRVSGYRESMHALLST
ncbi:MAG: hypothetical protein PHU21_12545, partial [Elusimicrobia bacterium]|nr:hypothetical protein [Elusimicrobiota bacterium]